MLKTNGVGWYRRRVADLETTVRFYRDTIGLPVIRERPGQVDFWLGERTELQLFSGGPRPAGYTDRSQAPLCFHLRAYPAEQVLNRAIGGGATKINDFQRDVNRLIYVTDPGGGVLGLNERYPNSPRPQDEEARRRWSTGQATPGPGALPPDIAPVGVYLVRCSALAPEVAFYRDLLGWETLSESDINVLVGIDDVTYLEIALGVPPQPVPSRPEDVTDLFVLRVTNLDAALAAARSAGYHTLDDIRTDATGREGYVLDGENHLVGVREE